MMTTTWGVWSCVEAESVAMPESSVTPGLFWVSSGLSQDIGQFLRCFARYIRNCNEKDTECLRFWLDEDTPAWAIGRIQWGMFCFRFYRATVACSDRVPSIKIPDERKRPR